jgi:hypothetical protein
VQDRGRPGHRHHGLPLSGWLDAPLAQAANALLGNDLKALIKPQLRELRAKMARQAGETGKAVVEAGDALAALADAADDAAKAADAHARSLRAKEETLAALRAETEASLAGAQRATEALTLQVSAVRQELAAAAGAHALKGRGRGQSSAAGRGASSEAVVEAPPVGLDTILIVAGAKRKVNGHVLILHCTEVEGGTRLGAEKGRNRVNRVLGQIHASVEHFLRSIIR